MPAFRRGPNLPHLVPLRDVANAIGLSTRTLRRRVEDGSLPAVRIKNRLYVKPEEVRAFVENQPVTSIVNAIRDLYAQQPVSADIWIALAWCVGILMVAYAFAMATYHRRVA